MKTYPNDIVDYYPIARECTGLTKLEHMAIEFTKAYIMSPKNDRPFWIEDNAKYGLSQARELIKALNE